MKNWFATVICLLIAASPSFADSPTISTDILPVQALVSAVTGSDDKTSIVPAGASPHDFALRPSAARVIANSEIIFWVGPSLSPWLGDTLETLAPSALKIQLLEGEQDHEDDHNHDHEENADAHVWLDPEVAIHWIKRVSDVLSQKTPNQAAFYFENASKAIADLERQIASISEKLAAKPPAPYVVYHDAYQAFEKHFGLSHVAAVTDNHATKPGAAQRKALITQITASHASCLLHDTPKPTALALQIAKEHNLKLIYVDPLGTNIKSGESQYSDILAHVADGFLKCQPLQH